MATIQLFLNVCSVGVYSEWNKSLTEGLNRLKGIEHIMIIQEQENNDAQVNVSCDVNQLDLEQIETITLKQGGNIASVNIHFPSEITGVADPYGASTISISTDKNIGQIVGVLGVSISSSGIVKVELTPTAKNKNDILRKIIESLSHKKK